MGRAITMAVFIVFMTVVSVCVAYVFIVAVLMLLLCTNNLSLFHFVVCVTMTVKSILFSTVAN